MTTMVMMMKRATLGLAAAAALACSKGDRPAGKVPLKAGPLAGAPAALDPAAKAALDSGNALFRKKAYDPALEQYRLAAQSSPAHAAPLFGIYMVARAQKNSALADSALAVLRSRGEASPSEHDDLRSNATPGVRDDASAP